MTDPVTRRYLDECLVDGSALRHAVERAPHPSTIVDMFGDRLLARPLLISERLIRETAVDVAGLFELLVSLPGRLFNGDIGRYCTELHITGRRAAYMRSLGDGRPPMHGRADLYHDGEALRLLEFNVGSHIGGTDRAEISRAFLQVQAFAEFASRHRLGYVHTGERMARLLREVAHPVTGGREPVVALIESDGGLPPFMPQVRANRQMMQRLGIDFRIGEVSQLCNRNGRLNLDGAPIDVVLRYFTVDELCADPRSEEVVAPILRAHREGTAVLYTPMESELYGNKGALALLFDARYRPSLTAEERAMVDRLVPWTHVLADRPAEVNGEMADLLDHCRQLREQLILKPFGDYGGDGIIAGWLTPAVHWERALAEHAGRGYVVQRRVRGRREPVVDPATGAVEDWLAVWDVFLTPHGYAGSHIRASRWDGRGIVGMSADANSRTTGIFYFADA